MPGVPTLRVRLPDGRIIAVAEHGDPVGPPVLYFHGFPACRLEAGLIDGLPVRLLAPDRPGYGQSTPQPGRTLLDWPQDVAHVADRLGLDGLHIVGLSGGAPYAAACAAVLGPRVRSLVLVCPVPPAHGVPEGAGGIGELIRFGRQPRRAATLFPLVRMLVRQRFFSIHRMVGRGLADADEAVLTPAIRDGLVAVWREALRHGVHGALSDARIYAADWGFGLDTVRVPTSLWCGGQDMLVPPATLRPYAAIPGIRWHLLEDEGHFSLPLRHVRTMVAALADEHGLAMAPSAFTASGAVGGQLSSSLSQYR